MNEMRAIIDLANKLRRGEIAALATVIKTEGSTYRRPGARMLVNAEGISAGTISGGCLESDVRERAQRVIQNHRTELVVYDSTSSEDIIFGLGLGCNGIVHLLIEPLCHGSEDSVISFLDGCITSLEGGRLVTAVELSNPPRISRLYKWPDGRISGDDPDDGIRNSLESALKDDQREVAISLPQGIACGNKWHIFAEQVLPPNRLTIFGAGDDAIPLGQLAANIGWHVTIVDPRSAYVSKDRFPMANEIHILRPEEFDFNGFGRMNKNSIAMIMTHNYNFDQQLLKRVLPLKLKYVGILGPRVRTQRILCDLAGEGTEFSSEELFSLHGPAGLDLGCETPGEIALSLIAEMMTVVSGRSGGFLRDRRSGIHSTVITEMAFA